MKLLEQSQITQKIKRVSIEILENNYAEKEVMLVGINNRGRLLSELILNELKAISTIQFSLCNLRIDPAAPLESEVKLDLPISDFENKSVIIVDDVVNTGRTLFYALKPFMEIMPNKIEIAVLVERHHKSFPIQVDYFGLSLATTLKEDIRVELSEQADYGAYLK